jgi:hypothetical protein
MECQAALCLRGLRIQILSRLVGKSEKPSPRPNLALSALSLAIEMST